MVKFFKKNKSFKRRKNFKKRKFNKKWGLKKLIRKAKVNKFRFKKKVEKAIWVEVKVIRTNVSTV